MRGITFAVGVLAVAAACKDPRIAVTLDFPDEVVPPCAVADCTDVSLVDGVERLEVSVYEFASHYCAVDDHDPMSNDDVPFGRVPAEVQAESLRSFVVLRRDDGFSGLELSGIPRLGHKVIVARGFDDKYQFLAGGCVDVGDIDDDLALTIGLERGLVVRVLPSELLAPSLILPAPGATLSILASQRRLTASVDRDSLRTSVRAEPTDVEVPYGTLGPSTVQGAIADVFPLTNLTTPDVIGPVELVVRGRWADEVNTASAIVLPEPIARFSLADEGLNLTDPSWAVIQAPGGLVHAVARYQSEPGRTQLVLAREEEGGGFRRVAIDAPGVLALAVVEDASANQTIATRTASGWGWLDVSQDPPVVRRGPEESTTAAKQLVGVPACVGRRVGVLGVVGDDVVGWSAIDGSPPAGPDTDIGALAARIDELAVDGATVEFLGAWCLIVSRADDVDRERPVVAVRRNGLGRQVTYLVTPDIPPLATPFVGGLSVTAQARPSLLAVTVGGSGPRIGTFRLRYTDTFAPAVVPDFVVDHPLPSAAISTTSMIVQRGEGKPVLIDTLGLHALGGAVGLSMTRASEARGDELSAMAAVDVPGTNHRFLRVNLEGTTQRKEVFVVGDNGLQVYDLTRPVTP